MPSIIRPSLNLRQQCRWHRYNTTPELEQAATLAIMSAAQKSISERNAFHLVLAGGTTPRKIYELLRTKITNWQSWHIYFGDERCLPVDHPERNSIMATHVWLDHVSIPKQKIHIIPAELGADQAATNYAKILSNIEMFDLVLLGLGEDGHTASLFPGHDWGTSIDAPPALAVNDAPKPPPQRVSLSAHRLSQTRQLMFLVTGESKRQAVKDWKDGKNIPAAAISPNDGVEIYLESRLS